MCSLIPDVLDPQEQRLCLYLREEVITEQEVMKVVEYSHQGLEVPALWAVRDFNHWDSRPLQGTFNLLHYIRRAPSLCHRHIALAVSYKRLLEKATLTLF